MTEQELESLIAVAKRRYPIGTIFNSTGGADGCTIVNHDFVEGYNNDLCINAKKYSGHIGKVTIADNKGEKWARITLLGTIEPQVINNYLIY